MSDIAIKVENISKKYLIGENKSYPTLRDKLVELPNRIFKGPTKTKDFWALKDVSFEVKRGEVVGIIGRNGAGKSTLLKILARITEPTTGQITMHGRVASMLEVGTGFNPELTGRENIYLNGAIIGMKKSEIKAKFDDIVEFSGVGKFLDTPVKHYSSGMYVRLAFAVAAHLDADILLVDEVLAVGDAEFQKKCLGKMSDLAMSGKTIILVSHNLEIIQDICDKTVLLSSDGNIAMGKSREVIERYKKNRHTNNLYTKRDHNNNSRELSFKKIFIKKIDEASLVVTLTFTVNMPVDRTQIVVHLWNQYGNHILSTSSLDSNASYAKLAIGQYTATLKIPILSLNNGSYRVTVVAGIPNTSISDELDGPWFDVQHTVPTMSQGRIDTILFYLLEWDINRK